VLVENLFDLTKFVAHFSLSKAADVFFLALSTPLVSSNLFLVFRILAFLSVEILPPHYSSQLA